MHHCRHRPDWQTEALPPSRLDTRHKITCLSGSIALSSSKIGRDIRKGGALPVAESIYRQSALDRVANPERLDASPTLVGRSHWLLLGGLTAAIFFGLIWSMVTQAPVKVEARGILISRSGLAEIVASDSGRIQSLLIAPGDLVRVGTPIARIGQVELVREIDDAHAKLTDAQARLARLEGFYDAVGSRESGADSVRLRTIADSRAALIGREQFLVEKLSNMRRLSAKGFVQRDRVVDTEIELADVRERLSNLSESVLRVGVDANRREGTTKLALLDEQRTIEEQQRLIARLSARLADQQVIRSQHQGRISEIKVNQGDVISAGTALATVAPDDNSGALIALLYVPTAEGKRIEAGMPAEIVPTTVERAVYGHIPGKVISVAPLPATAQGMRRVLQNDTLVQELMASGAPIEVRIALIRDRSNSSGFAWSASSGPHSRISAGSSISGAVVVNHKPVIGWLIPSTGRD